MVVVVVMAELLLGARGPPVAEVDPWMRRLRKVAATRGVTVQALDARAVCGRSHVESALLHARRAFERGRQFSKTLEVEWVLCAAGARQVSSAFARAGVRPGTDSFALLLLTEGDAHPRDDIVASLLAGMDLVRDDGALECTRDAMQILGIGETELAAVPEERWPDLVLERVALLDLQR